MGVRCKPYRPWNEVQQTDSHTALQLTTDREREQPRREVVDLAVAEVTQEIWRLTLRVDERFNPRRDTPATEDEYLLSELYALRVLLLWQVDTP